MPVCVCCERDGRVHMSDRIRALGAKPYDMVHVLGRELRRMAAASALARPLAVGASRALDRAQVVPQCGGDVSLYDVLRLATGGMANGSAMRQWLLRNADLSGTPRRAKLKDSYGRFTHRPVVNQAELPVALLQLQHGRVGARAREGRALRTFLRATGAPECFRTRVAAARAATKRIGAASCFCSSRRRGRA